MSICSTRPARIRAICSSVPERLFDNLNETTAFDRKDVEKVVKLAGVRTRHMASDQICSSDLCVAAAKRVLERLDWDPQTVDALIFVTQSQDYLLPSTACIVQHWLGPVGRLRRIRRRAGLLGVSRTGLWLASMMLGWRWPQTRAPAARRNADEILGSLRSIGGLALRRRRVGNSIRSRGGGRRLVVSLHTDGSGWRDLIVEGGGFRDRFPADPKKHFVSMNGAGIFNFAIKRIPPTIQETLAAAGVTRESIDYFILHQSNLFIMRHLAQKMGIPEAKIPLSIERFGSAGGPSVPLTLTQGGIQRPADRALRLLLVGYGVGLSWGSALLSLPPDAVLDHVEVSVPFAPAKGA
jgi:3-oxoacyl-[acyl-carrier-protein] synthase-3